MCTKEKEKKGDFEISCETVNRFCKGGKAHKLDYELDSKKFEHVSLSKQ